MTAKHILVIYDGKAGHLSQSYGMAKLVADRHPGSEIQVLSAKPVLKLLNRPLRWLAKQNGISAPYIISSLYKMEKIPAQGPDLVISFGGNVLALSLSLSRYWQCPNIVIGNLYGMPETLADCHVTAFGEQGSDENRLASRIALCKTDPSACIEAGRALLNEHGDQKLWSMLIGGDGSGYHYSEPDWHQLGKAMQSLSASHNIRWLVSTSRRSGDLGLKILKHYCDDSICAQSIWFGEANQPSIDAFFGAAERIFCSEDSISMLSEAVAMNKPVISIKPARLDARKTHSAMLEHLQGSGLIESMAIDQLHRYQPQAFAPKLPYQQQLAGIYQRLVDIGILVPSATMHGVKATA